MLNNIAQPSKLLTWFAKYSWSILRNSDHRGSFFIPLLLSWTWNPFIFLPGLVFNCIIYFRFMPWSREASFSLRTIEMLFCDWWPPRIWSHCGKQFLIKLEEKYNIFARKQLSPRDYVPEWHKCPTTSPYQQVGAISVGASQVLSLGAK